MFAWMLWSVACQSNSPELADEVSHILGERRLSLSHNGVVRNFIQYQPVTLQCIYTSCLQLSWLWWECRGTNGGSNELIG